MIRSAFASILVLHGLLHLLGVAKGFGLAALPQLSRPIGRPAATLWLAAGLLVLATAAALPLAPGGWWLVGAVALLVSQGAILTSWRDARFGTVANLVLLLGVAWGFAHRGPWSLPAEYARRVAASAPAPTAGVLTEADLAPLPPPVRRYVRAAEVVGQPRVGSFHATWIGRIRAGPSEPWMAFTAEQVNTLDTPRRFFLMDAAMKGLPVDVLHVLDERGATMRVRLLSVKTMVDAGGEVLTRSETVTFFNDLCLLAPGELVRPAIAWEPVDDRTARARFTLGVNTIGATLVFDAEDRLVDFVTEDRNPSPDGSASGPVRWTTPVSAFARIGPARVALRAEARWHPASGGWSYGEFELRSLRYGPGR